MKILMVCLGNICRSPMAEGILRHQVRQSNMQVETDSAGTSHYHFGEGPDHRATRAMLRHGIDISDLRARQFTAADFHTFDRILAMDESNLANMIALAPDAAMARKVMLIMDHVPDHALRSVPDPYFGGEEGFEQVYHMLTEACNALIKDIQKNG